MSAKLKRHWSRKISYGLWSTIGLGLVVVLVLLAMGHLDFDNPTVALNPPVDVVGAKTILTVSAVEEKEDIPVLVTRTLMQSAEDKARLARECLEWVGRGCLIT